MCEQNSISAFHISPPHIHYFIKGKHVEHSLLQNKIIQCIVDITHEFLMEKKSSYSQTQSYCGLKMDNNSPVTGTLKVFHLVPHVVEQIADNLFACKLHKDYAMLLNNKGLSSSFLESYIFIGALHVGTVSPTNSSKGIEFYISVEVLWKILT